MAWVQVVKGVLITFNAKSDDFDDILSSDMFISGSEAITNCDGKIVEEMLDDDNLKLHIVVGASLTDEIDAETLEITKLKSINKEMSKQQKLFVESLTETFHEFKPKVKEGVFLVKID